MKKQDLEQLVNEKVNARLDAFFSAIEIPEEEEIDVEEEAVEEHKVEVKEEPKKNPLRKTKELNPKSIDFTKLDKKKQDLIKSIINKKG